jgi:hypothetical protein
MDGVVVIRMSLHGDLNFDDVLYYMYLRLGFHFGADVAARRG